MAIPLTGAGSLGVILGHIFGRQNDLLALRGAAKAGPFVPTTASYPTNFATMVTDLTGGTAKPKTLARFNPFTNLSNWDSQQSSLLTNLAAEAQAVLCALYNFDQATVLPEDFPPYPQANKTIVQYLVQQMTGATISAPTSTVQNATAAVGAQTNFQTPAGTPVIITSNKNVQGLLLQLMFPETITFVCTRDANSGGATLGQETLSFFGETAAPVYGYQYPAGSGAAGSLTLVNGEVSNGAGNILQNSGFNVMTTANSPDNWTISVGAAGATVLDGTSTNVYTTGNTHVLEFAGDGATLAALTQSFNTAVFAGPGGGTTAKLLPDTQYAVSLWVKVAGGAPAAGVLELALIDGSANVLNDDNAVANSKTFDLTAGGLNIGATYTNINAVFRTPSNLLTQTTPFKIRLRQSTALTSGKNAFMARMSMSVMAPLYPGGPFCQAVSSNVAPINGLVPDTWTVAVTNNYATSGTGLFQMMFDRAFGMRLLGLQLPYGAGTILDSLIA